RIAETKTDHAWQAVWLENEFLRVMILPEIGGRIHAIEDKTNGYDLIYNQAVIKPALVGLTGPWISGGIEFNWPQHHRPSTFTPANGHYYGIDYGSRGSDGVPSEEKPNQFVPPGDYPANDLSWYANIPVPTSYMCIGTNGDFFGGYDHARRAGFVHVADHHIA